MTIGQTHHFDTEPVSLGEAFILRQETRASFYSLLRRAVSGQTTFSFGQLPAEVLSARATFQQSDEAMRRVCRDLIGQDVYLEGSSTQRFRFWIDRDLKANIHGTIVSELPRSVQGVLRIVGIEQTEDNDPEGSSVLVSGRTGNVYNMEGGHIPDIGWNVPLSSLARIESAPS